MPSMVLRVPGWVALGVAALAGCSADAPTVANGACAGITTVSAESAVACLAAAGAIPPADGARADSVLRESGIVLDSIRASNAYERFRTAGIVLASQQHFTDFYDRGLLADSTRFNRLVDHLAVTLEYVRGELVRDAWGLHYPRMTPGLGWSFQDQIGIYFEPALSVERRMGAIPPALGAPDPVFESLGEAMWRYANHGAAPGGPVARWELTYSSRICIGDQIAPRVSALAQGAALNLFGELYRVTGDMRWRDRGDAVVRSLDMPWSAGGVRMDDTTHGYWWESASPGAMAWRGHAVALVAVLRYARLTGDTVAGRLADGGLRAAAYWTPRFDTGTWTRFCLSGGYSDPDTHRLFIGLARTLADLTGGGFWDVTAERWEEYARARGAGEGA